MQSKPDGWKFSVDLISSQSKESKSSISEGLKELEGFGYLERKKRQSGNGFIIDYHLFFESVSINPIADFQSLEIQVLENPMLGNPIIGKSVNNSKKDISNKDISKKEGEGALNFLEINFPSQYEILLMQYKSRITDFVKFSEMLEATIQQERLEFDLNVLSGRFKKFAINWISNQSRFDEKVIPMHGNFPKEKISGF
jgi:hypothetical protein